MRLLMGLDTGKMRLPMDLDTGKMLLKEDTARINRKVMPAVVVMGNATETAKVAAGAAVTNNLINKLVGNRTNKIKKDLEYHLSP